MPKASRDKMMAKTQREKSIVMKQKVFADAILEGATQCDAARAAGYHPASAATVMRNEQVQQYIEEARHVTEDLSTIKRLDVLNMFMEAIDMARTLADPANMINGADKIAKMMGYYAPETKRIELTTDQAVFHSKLRQLSDAELMELAAGTARVVEGEVLQ